MMAGILSMVRTWGQTGEAGEAQNLGCRSRQSEEFRIREASWLRLKLDTQFCVNRRDL